jgi:hypothetical protein
MLAQRRIRLLPSAPAASDAPRVEIVGRQPSLDRLVVGSTGRCKESLVEATSATRGQTPDCRIAGERGRFVLQPSPIPIGNPPGSGSSRQGWGSCGVRVPAPSIGRFGRLASPMREEVTNHPRPAQAPSVAAGEAQGTGTGVCTLPRQGPVPASGLDPDPGATPHLSVGERVSPWTKAGCGKSACPV